ncbi:HD domain-containing protein [Paenibacillus sp. GCM10027626]|uniref:HD domain-containing protein n=1 Tax=Paenibacillus sp. GCM10027626 TaxID=3273411 RepID=UPI003641648B
MNLERLQQQIAFIMEIDKMKSIYRKSIITDRSRQENDAEHSWHLAMMAVVLLEHANAKSIDPLRVIKMVLVHDLVEIDAGDTFAYDDAGHEDKYDRELAAAERIFGILPEEQGCELMELWQEFEARATPESQFAAAIDRLAPMLLNYYTEGHSWKEYGITSDQVIARNRHIGNGSEALWQYAQTFIEDAVQKGFLAEKKSEQ